MTSSSALESIKETCLQGYQVPTWAVEPSPKFYLEVTRDGKALGAIPLDKRKHVFGRHETCETVCEHQSLSRFHAAIAHQQCGSVYLIDLGSSHGTHLNDSKVPKWIPTLLQEGNVVRLAGSSRQYTLKHVPFDPNNPDNVVTFNTLCNRKRLFTPSDASAASGSCKSGPTKSARVSFRGSVGADKTELEEVIGFSDGSGFAVGVGPKGVEKLQKLNGSDLKGQFENMLQSTIVLPKAYCAAVEIQKSPKTVSRLSIGSPGSSRAIAQANFLKPRVVTSKLLSHKSTNPKDVPSQARNDSSLPTSLYDDVEINDNRHGWAENGKQTEAQTSDPTTVVRQGAISEFNVEGEDQVETDDMFT